MDLDNPTPAPGHLGRVVAQQQWENLESEQLDEDVYLQDLAGVENLSDACTLRVVVNTSTATVSHLGSKLPQLLELNLSGSVLESLRDLGTDFRQLSVLWVPRCGLTGLSGASGLPALRELYAAYNDIVDLQPLDSCAELEVLDVEGNCISELDTLDCLSSGCPRLQNLNLAGNPAASQPSYRHNVRSWLPSLRLLDDVPAEDVRDLPAAGGSSASASLEALSSSDAMPSASAAHPPLDERSMVTEGIKHARVGLDSQEFKELEMSLLLAADMLASEARPSTSAMMMPVTAGSWLRCSTQGSGAGGMMRHSMSRSSPLCSVSGSRPESEQDGASDVHAGPCLSFHLP